MLESFRDKFVIGMVHLPPLPSSPNFDSIDHVFRSAEEDSSTLVEGGVDAVLIENYGDIPFKKEVSRMTAMAMTAVIKDITGTVPVGVNVLRNDWKTALSIAHVLDLDFIRINVYTGVTATDQGLIEGCAADVQRFIREHSIDCDVLADVHVKHGRTIHQADIGMGAKDAVYRGMADAVIVSGISTGIPPKEEDIKEVSDSVDVPVIIGSGLTADNCTSLMKFADGAIVGSFFKEGGRIRVGRIRDLMKRLR